MICVSCLARDYGSDEQREALIRYQAQQLDRLTHLAYGIPYTQPDPEDLVWGDDEDDEEPAPPPRDALTDLETVLWDQDIHRKPPRVAAPRIIERLAEVGWHLTNGAA